MSELKPCPFCGGEATVFIKDWDNRADEYKIVCMKCGVQQEEFRHEKAKAIEAWNRRVTDDAKAD